ncbi:MAG: GNAT family N-acetyltransferase, partial [Eubacteriales bacterium]
MVIRKITNKDDYKASLVSAVAFEYGFDYIKERDDAIAALNASEENNADAEEKSGDKPAQYAEKLPADDVPNVTWGAFDENDVCFSAVCVPPYSVRFDGTYQLMGGIGGVSSLPHYRRRGGIRECMRSALRDMYDNGFSLSYLYPFSRAYYRKFGYENGMETRTYTLQFSAIRRYNVGGSIEMLLPGDESSALTEIYTRFYSDYNYSVVRREYDGSLSKRNTVSEKRY